MVVVVAGSAGRAGRQAVSAEHIAPVVTVVKAQLAAHDQLAALVAEPQPRNPAVVLVRDRAAAHHVAEDAAVDAVDDDRIAVPVLQVVVGREARAVRGVERVEPVARKRLGLALLVVVAAAVEPEQRLREREPRPRRPGVHQLVVRLEEVIGLVGVGEWVVAAVLVRVSGQAAIQHRTWRSLVREVRLLGPAEEVEAQRMIAEHPAHAQIVGPEPRPRLVAVAVGLDPRVATVVVPAVRKPPRVHLDHEAARAIVAVGEARAHAALLAEGRRLEAHSSAHRGRAVERGPHAALHLRLRRRGEEVGVIDPVDLVRLRIVERHAVDEHADPPLRESAQRQVRVSDAVPRVGVCVGAGECRERHGRVLAPVHALDLGARERRACDRRPLAGACRADHDLGEGHDLLQRVPRRGRRSSCTRGRRSHRERRDEERHDPRAGEERGWRRPGGCRRRNCVSIAHDMPSFFSSQPAAYTTSEAARPA